MQTSCRSNLATWLFASTGSFYWKLMRFRDRRFLYLRFRGQHIFESIPNKSSVICWPIPRIMPFYLAVDFGGLMCFQQKDCCFFFGDLIFENLIIDSRVRVFSCTSDFGFQIWF